MEGMTTYQVIALKLDAHKPPSRLICTTVGDEHWALMIRCWSPAPRLRPSAREVVAVVQALFSPGANTVDGRSRHSSVTSELSLHILFFFIRAIQ